MLEKYLKEIGLSEKEVAVYLYLLGVKDSAVTEIAKGTKIKRPTVYTILDSLANKGLTSETTVGNKTKFQVEPPERLTVFIERQKTLLDEKAKILKGIIPELKAMQRETGERPVVKYFEGKEGILSSVEEIFDKKIDNEPTYIIYSKDLVEDIFTEKEKKELKNKRISKNIKSKAIYTSTKGSGMLDETGDRIQINEKKYPIDVDITVYGDKVKISILKEKLAGISIKSPELAETFKSLINLVFDLNRKGPGA